MQFTRTLAHVREMVEADDAGKWDATVPCRDVSLFNGRLHFAEARRQNQEEGLSFTDHSLAQFCARLGIPASYFRKCPPHLKDAQANHWLRAENNGRSDPNETWLLRAKGPELRGVLSERYSRLDNRQIIDALQPFAESDRLKVGLSQISPESFHLRLVDPGLGKDVLPGDRLMVGIHLSNSEVGLRSVTVDALVFRLVCTNGLIRRIDGRSLLRQRHLYVSEPRFAEMLLEALSVAMVVAGAFLEQLGRAARTPVPHPEQAISLLSHAWELSQSTEELVRLSLLSEPGSQQESLYGLVNALTNAAQRLPIEERVRLETLAGGLADPESPSQAERVLRSRVLSAREEVLP